MQSARKILSGVVWERGFEVLTLTALLLLVSCEAGTDSPKAVSASITPGDTTAFAGDALTFEAVVEFESGPAAPETVVWQIVDPEVLSLTIVGDGRAAVTAIERGASHVVATINETFVDSSLVQVVRPGDVRWRVPIGATWLIPTPALDGEGRIYVVSDQAIGRALSAFDPDGSLVYSLPTCPFSDMSPGVSLKGLSHVTGWACTQRHASDGSTDWTFPGGSFDGGAMAHVSDILVLVSAASTVGPPRHGR